jgi:hypothetical protein
MLPCENAQFMASSRKKVLVRRFSGVVTPGYLPPANLIHGQQVDLLDLDGRVIPLPINDIKMISFVRDFNLADKNNPERILRKTFLARPRSEGLWVRLTFRDGDLLEGLAPVDISFIDSIQADAGLQISPPDTRSNTQRIYVPRAALSEAELVAVITAPSRRKPLLVASTSTQEELFHSELPPNARPN